MANMHYCQNCHYKTSSTDGLIYRPGGCASCGKSQYKCPKCGKMKAKRLISAGAGLIFKGSGFYLTDYRSDSYKKGAAADSGGSSGSGEKSGGSGGKD